MMKFTLTPHTILQRLPNLHLQIDSSNQVQILMGGKSILCGPQGLAVLEAFAHPTSLGEALKIFHARGAQHWMDVTSTVVTLYRAGVLRDPAQAQSAIAPDAAGFGSVPIHVAMLNDRRRTASFLAGIAEVVRTGDVVVDIGTGTGILAIAAARAGAAHVYAIEAIAIASVARAIFQAGGLEDRISLVQGLSTEVALPERADVLVSEIIGNDPWGERVLQVTRDAKTRLLKPSARFVPSRIHVFGLPLTVPHGELMKRTATAETLDHWQAWYDVDFSPLAEMARHAVHAQFSLKPHLAREWKRLSDPVLLAEVEFNTLQDIMIDRTINVTATAAGELNGLLVYFELTLGPTTTLSTHPDLADESNHWRSPVFLFGEPLSVQPGDRFGIQYQWGVAGRQSEVRLVS